MTPSADLCEPFPELPKFSGGGLQPGVDLDDNAGLRAILDQELGPDKPR